MGRSLGYFDSDELDRPELNKCPDCECYFASDACPLCGKICPEEMRAGHRARVKPPKKRKNSSGRVQFVEWYHSWWFILLMLYFMPIVGIILFFTSPHSKKSKIIAAVVVLGAYLLTAVLGYLWLWYMTNQSPVNDDISKEDYVERCIKYDVHDFYRKEPTEGLFITMEVEVVSRHVDDYEGATYYLCRPRNGGSARVYIRDCDLEKTVNYLPGDILRVYGESAGVYEVYDEYGSSSYPCLNVAYADLVREGEETSGSLCVSRASEALLRRRPVA